MPIPTYTSEIKGLDAQISMLAKAKPVVFEEIRKGIVSSLKIIRSEVQPRTPVFSGYVKRNWRTEIKQIKGVWTGRFYNRHRFHLQMIVQGRQPGAPIPMYAGRQYPERFVNWVKAKMNPAESELMNTLYRVGRAISYRGVKARPIVEEGAKASEARVIAAMNTAVQNALNKLANKGK